MNAPVAARTTTRSAGTSLTALRAAQAALAVGAAFAIVLGAVDLFVTTSPYDSHFRHAGDYVQTADGLPYMAAMLVLLLALRVLQQRRGGLFELIGIGLGGAGALALIVVLAYDLVVAKSDSLGAAYPLAALATVVGVAVFAVGSWRAGLLPRWLVVAWPIAWALGSALPIPGPWPLLLAAAYIAMAILLPRLTAPARADRSPRSPA